MTSIFRKLAYPILSATILGVSVTANACTQNQYEIIDLGTLETDRSSAYCINDNCQVCGTYTFQNEEHYFLWDPKNGTSCLELPKNVLPMKINNKGQIIGCHSPENGKRRGFFWDSITGFVDLGTLGGDQTFVSDLNDKGQVVGWSYTSTGADCESHAFLWEKGLINDLGTLCGELCLGGNRSAAIGINNGGQIVGYSNHAMMHKGKKIFSSDKAVIWEEGEIRRLEIPGEEIYHGSQAVAINNRGQLVYIHEKKIFVRNLSSNEDVPLIGSGLSRTKITDNGAMLDYSWVQINRLNKGSSVYSPFSNGNLKDTIWKSIEGQTDINNEHWITGIGETIYGEHHAVLLRPKQ